MPMEIIRQKWYPRNWNIRKWGNSRKCVRCVKNAGAFVNSSCGMHVHVDASKHTPQSLKNALSIMYSKEDILFKALNVNESRVKRWCRKVREPMLEKSASCQTNATMERFKQEWYEGTDGSCEHYNWTRYYALNLHSVFYRGTLEWRCFESTLHAGKVRSNITLALAISAQAINQSCTAMRKDGDQRKPGVYVPHLSAVPRIDRGGIQKCAKHLLANLDGDKAWRYDKSTYACLQNPRRTDDAR